jgi:hypothetical protein
MLIVPAGPYALRCRARVSSNVRPLMGKRFVVIDQNVLRKPYLETLLVDDPDLRVVLPDLAFLEMTKSPEWESTLRNSLATLSRYPRRVYVCQSVNETLRLELSELKSHAASLSYPDATKFVRDILDGFRNGTGSASLERIRENPDGHLDELIAQHLNHEGNKDGLAQLVDSTAGMIPAEAKKRLRAGSMPDDERLDVLHQIGTSMLPEILASRDIAAPQAIRLRGQKPMLLRYLYLKAWRCLRWLSSGGFESFPPKSVTNEELDDQYILAATCYHGLLSEERASNEAYRDLRQLLTREA